MAVYHRGRAGWAEPEHLKRELDPLVVRASGLAGFGVLVGPLAGSRELAPHDEDGVAGGPDFSRGDSGVAQPLLDFPRRRAARVWRGCEVSNSASGPQHAVELTRRVIAESRLAPVTEHDEVGEVVGIGQFSGRDDAMGTDARAVEAGCVQRPAGGIHFPCARVEAIGLQVGLAR